MDIFPFGQPVIYFETVRMTVMVLSLYHSLWIVNFLGLSINKLHSGSWAVLSVAPGLLSFLCYTYIVKVASLLKVTVSSSIICIKFSMSGHRVGGP